MQNHTTTTEYPLFGQQYAGQQGSSQGSQPVPGVLHPTHTVPSTKPGGVFNPETIGLPRQHPNEGKMAETIKSVTQKVLGSDAGTLVFSVANNGDLVAIKRAQTGSKTTEVNILAADSRYQKYRLQTGTCLGETDETYTFALGPNNDLFAIKRSKTASAHTEVQIVSAASNYQKFGLQSPTALPETDLTHDFRVAPNGDLYVIKRTKTGSHSTELHVLSAASGYKNFSLETGTALPETDETFSFVVATNNDLIVIKKSKTASKQTEVQVLTAVSGYKSVGLQTPTALHETDETFDFAIGPNNDLYVIKKSKTESHSVEVHVLSAVSGYKDFSLHTGTALGEVVSSL